MNFGDRRVVSPWAAGRREVPRGAAEARLGCYVSSAYRAPGDRTLGPLGSRVTGLVRVVATYGARRRCLGFGCYKFKK